MNLLSVSRLDQAERYKGLDTTLKALALAREGGISVHLRVAGSGTDLERLSDLASDLGLTGVVEFMGSVSRDQLLRSYAECDGFVLPSSQEGFGIVYLEAASHGKASIAASAGAASEMLRDRETGFLVPPDDPDALARTLREIATTPTLLASVGARARQDLSERYSFIAFRNRLGALIDQWR
jgi:phosphatidylinositol alpha-1,6-mannosyltransferase